MGNIGENLQRNNVAQQVEGFCISYFAAFREPLQWREGAEKELGRYLAILTSGLVINRWILRSDVKADFIIHPSNHISLIQYESVYSILLPWMSFSQSATREGAFNEIRALIRKRALIGRRTLNWIITQPRFLFVCFLQVERKLCPF